VKVLLSIMSELTPDSRQRRLADEQTGTMSQWSAFERLFNTECIDYMAVRRAPWYRRAVYRFLPRYFSLACELFLMRHDYDVVVTAWSEPLSISFALLQYFFAFRRTRHVMVGYWFSKVSVASLLRLVHPAINLIVTWSSAQKTFAENHLGIPKEKMRLVSHPVDPFFWAKQDFRPSPAESPTDYICSAGAEMRDYPTLIEAMKGLPAITCQIAAREIRILSGLKAVNRSAQELAPTLPPNVKIRAYPQLELRDLVQRSRFIVVPLLPTDTDNGITVILEAMAAGKAIICSKTHGQVDAIVDGETGLLVEPSNPEALRNAILDLWNHPEKASAIGKKAQDYIKNSRHPLERFTQDLVAITQSVVDSR
jgi:glycosyltransferase involved in cell wall biosynthesis